MLRKPKKSKVVPILILVALIGLLLFIFSDDLSFKSGKKLTILHTNDLYAQLGPLKEEVDGKEVEIGGLPRISTLVKDIRKNNERVLLLDGGDTTKGTLFTSVHGSLPVAMILNKLKYDAIVIGDHDFYDGPEGLARYNDAAKYPFLAANFDYSKCDVLVKSKKIKPYIILDLEGLKVGLIGLTTVDANLYAKSGNDVFINDPIPVAKEVVKEIRPKTDIIIVLSHMGLTVERKVASQVPGIDIIVGGGSQTKLLEPVKMMNPEGKPTLILQAKNQGRYLGKLDLSVNKNDIEMLDYKLIDVNETIEPDKELQPIVDKLYVELNKEVNKTIGETVVDFDVLKDHLRSRETNLGILFAEAVKERFPEVDIVFQNSGGLRENEIFPAGKITKADVWHWHPFHNTIVLATLTGKQIKEVLERGACNLPIARGSFLQVAGLRCVVDITAQPQELTEDNTAIKQKGNRIMDVTINGKPLDPKKEYRVAINDFLAPGGDGFITFQKVKDLEYTSIYLTDIVIDYIQKNSPLNIKTDGRMTVKGGLYHQEKF